MHLIYIVLPSEDKKSVKYILKNRMDLSEKLIKKLKCSNKVFCNSVSMHINALVSMGDKIEVLIDFDEVPENISPEKIDIDIIYEDDCLIALNKQAGLVVHPTFNHPSGTIANALSYYFYSKNIYKKIRPVSRLDKDTSGIIVFAKNEYIQASLINQMKSKTYLKEYLGIVNGIVAEQSGTIDLPIARKPDSIIMRHVSPIGNTAITKYKVIRYLNNSTFLKFTLETGRTHQIRVHCQAINHPLIGETLYSDLPTDLIGRQALHSHKVKFIHPFTKLPLELKAPVPEDIAILLK
jgi:23S rRNA pseudouridine1911/1915/1917 synthase